MKTKQILFHAIIMYRYKSEEKIICLFMIVNLFIKLFFERHLFFVSVTVGATPV